MNGTSGAVPILNYHTISDDPGPVIAPYAVGREAFASHLDVIQAAGGTALTVTQYVDRLERGTALPVRPVVITFDDGFEDNLTVAAPLLAARDMPATVYVTTGLLPGCLGGGAGRPLGPMILWEHLPELEKTGIEVGAHSHSHPELDVLDREAAAWEIRRSRDLLELALGHPLASFSYPHGYAGGAIEAEVRRHGFLSACGVRHAISHRGDNPWLLARLVVGPRTTPAELDRWVHGTGARLAGRRERLRTKAWRHARRASPSPAATTVPSLARPVAYRP